MPQGSLTREILIIVALGVIPTVIGHTLLNLTMKMFRGQVVALANMGQFLFAGIMAFVIPAIGETPGMAFYPASLLVIIGVTVALRPHKGSK